MTKLEVTKEVKSLIASAQTNKALTLLIGFLQGDKKYSKLQQIAINTQNLYNKTQLDKNKGILGQEHILRQENVVNDTLYQLTQHIENDNLNPEEFNPIVRKKKSNKLMLGLLGLIPILLGVIAYFFIFPPGPSCPDFSARTDFHVMLLPFKNLGSGQLSPETAIKERLVKLSSEENVPAEVKIFSNYFDNNENDLPDYDEAVEIGEGCHAEMLIWGTAENTSDGKIVNAKYRYLGAKDGLVFNQLKWEGEKQVDTLKAISSIMNQGELTAEIETLILAILLHQEGRTDEMLALLEKVNPQNNDEAIVTHMLMADGYSEKKDFDKALVSYEKVLDSHPNYWLARCNKGILAIENGRFDEGINDLSEVLKKRPEDIDVLNARGEAFIKNKQLKRAVEDFEKVKNIEPNNGINDEKIKVIRKKIAEAEATLNLQYAGLARNPDNLDLLVKQTETAQVLGMDDLVEKNSEKLLRSSQFAETGASNLLHMYVQKSDTTKVQETILKARNKGVKDSEIIRSVPSIRRALKDLNKNN